MLTRGAARWIAAGLWSCGVVAGGCAPNVGEGDTCPPNAKCFGPEPVACKAGEATRNDGSCQVPGIPPDGCAKGFKHDGDRGCAAVLPAMPCGPGTLAVPGDSACHEVAPCAAGPFPAAPSGGKAVYADGSYQAGNSDGTMAHPWTTIQQAVDAAGAGDAVLVAAGKYAEDVSLAKAVRVIGLCPAKVELAGPKGVAVAASNAELHALAVTGGGVAVSKASGVVLAGVWLHDTGAEALLVDEGAAALRSSLIEHPVGYGIRAHAGDVTVEASVVRDVNAGKILSAGIYASPNFTAKKPSHVVVRGSLIERMPYAGIYASSSDVTLDGSVLRDVTPGADGEGDGLNVLSEDLGAKLTVTGSVIERVTSEAMFLGRIDAHIDTTVVRTAKPTATSAFPSGINGGTEIGSGSLTLFVQRSLIEDFPAQGVVAFGGTVVLDSVAIRDIHADKGGTGMGLYLASDLDSEAPANGTVQSSAIERVASDGVWVSSSSLTADNLAVRDVGAAAPVIGTGILAYTSMGKKRTSVTVTHSLVDGARMVGIWSLGSDTVVEDTTVQKTRPDTQGNALGLATDASPEPATLVARRTTVDGSTGTGVGVYHASTVTLEDCRISNTVAKNGIDGDAISVLSKDAVLTVTKTRIDHSARAGIASFGAKVTIGGSTLSCQSFDFDSEQDKGAKASFSDAGGNTCGCPEATGGCHAATAMLQPPDPLPVPSGP